MPVPEYGSWFLPGLPVDLIRACYDSAPGNEFESGKFGNPESSAALAANAFGYFLQQPRLLPVLPKTESFGWPASSIKLEACMRFPWSGGHHPYLDVGVQTGRAVIGIESKRFEPFRDKHKVQFSKAYWRPVWGQEMARFEGLRGALGNGELTYRYLDACQLVKHAFGLRSEIARHGLSRKALLFYLFAEPLWGPSTGDISQDAHLRHREEAADFGSRVAGDEVEFRWCSYRELLTSWRKAGGDLARHADAVISYFAPA